MINKNQTTTLVKKIFQENWKDKFLFDGLNDEIYTYEDFFCRVVRCKEKLYELGLREKDTICIFMNNSVDVITLYFAALLLQITIVAIDPNKGKDEIKEILSIIEYKMVISNISSFDLVKEWINFERLKPGLEIKKSDDVSELENITKLNFDNLFIITFTSGSTGKPKGVMHSFNNFILSSISFRDRFSFNRDNVFYHNLPMSYIGGILNLIVLPFISESKIVVGERFNVSNITKFWQTPIKYSANTFWFIPTIISLLLKLDRGNDGIDYTEKNTIVGLVGTAPLNEQAKFDFQEKYGISLFESYGLSETFFIATNFPNNDRAGSPGKLLDGVSLTFSPDEEILLDVPWMFFGYVGLDNKKYFQDKKYLSGDLGKIDDEFLYIIGRKKDLIIKGGTNLSPKKLEDFLNKLDIFEECVIIGTEDSVLGEKIVCVFVSNEKNMNNELTKETNRKIIDRLGLDYQIDEFFKIEEIPRNINGKIDRPKIREIYQTSK